MSEQGQFDLCPKCGAVTRDGVCQSCGYEIPGIQDAMEQTAAQQASAQQTDNGLYTTPDVYETQTGQDVYQTPDMSNEHHDTGGMFSGNHTNENTAYQQNMYDNSRQNGGQYGKQPYPGAANPYEQNTYNNNQYGLPYGANPYGNNLYSPYAVPPAKKHNGVIIGIIITVVILFFIALFAIIYNALEAASDKPAKSISAETKLEESQSKYVFAFYDEFFGEYWFAEHIDDAEYLEEFYNEYFGDEWYEEHLKELEELENSIPDDDDVSVNDDADNSDEDDIDYAYDEYYTLQDDIKSGLSYSIDWDYYEYAPNDNVKIAIDYPIIVGNRVPNLDRINAVLEDEIAVFTEYYEDEYSAYMDEDSYFFASAMGYVTYMSEDVLSVVFSESISSDYYVSVYCYSINIDMQDGVIMDNTDIIAVDDDFSVDFRYRSEEQNGTIDTLDWMSDQEITELLTSSGNLIIYYTPMGMEIGFNYEDGWVTVTYHDYKDYLKIF